MKVLPMPSPRVSQEYGRKNPAYRKGYHTGIDLVSTTNDKSIRSISPGKVLKVGWDPAGWGNYVIVRQHDGHDVLYAHLDFATVKKGDQVLPHDRIGLQGNTGNSTGPHLHLEIWQGSWTERNDINPADYLGIENRVGPLKWKEVNTMSKDKPSDWAKSVWEWGVKEGITDGSNPQKTATREEVISMLHKALVVKKS